MKQVKCQKIYNKLEIMALSGEGKTDKVIAEKGQLLTVKKIAEELDQKTGKKRRNLERKGTKNIQTS